MTEAEIKAALQAAFSECEASGYGLTLQQKELLMRSLAVRLEIGSDGSNPLDDLTSEQRQALLDFVSEQQAQAQPWKMQILNDWLAGRDSGRVQFVREQYGMRWLERIQPVHLAQYTEAVVKLKAGDRIEVSNNLWEWVQEEGPCSREWFACTVISVNEDKGSSASCTIRFDSGAEYEIQGIYDWNRYNWRWMQ
jgi:hypothetical protein